MGAGMLFIVLLLQSIYGHYGNKIEEAWALLLPAIMPTLSLVTAFFASTALNEEKESKIVSNYAFFMLNYKSYE